MWRKLKIAALKWFYRLLIVKISFVDKNHLPSYDKFKVFCSMPLQTNRGQFTFVFKEDRRSRVRVNVVAPSLLSSYFVELICPETLVVDSNVFKDTVIVVVKIKTAKTINYEALAELLLDLYISRFTSR